MSNSIRKQTNIVHRNHTKSDSLCSDASTILFFYTIVNSMQPSKFSKTTQVIEHALHNNFEEAFLKMMKKSRETSVEISKMSSCNTRKS